MRQFQPENGAGPINETNNVVKINLNSTGFLDGAHSFLSFDVKLTGSTDVGFDGSVHSLIIWRFVPPVRIQDLPILVLLHLQIFMIRPPYLCVEISGERQRKTYLIPIAQQMMDCD